LPSDQPGLEMDRSPGDLVAAQHHYRRLFLGRVKGMEHGSVLYLKCGREVVLQGSVFVDFEATTGILCSCCSEVLSCERFAQHGGGAGYLGRSPYEAIFTRLGKSLKQLGDALPPLSQQAMLRGHHVSSRVQARIARGGCFTGPRVAGDDEALRPEVVSRGRYGGRGRFGGRFPGRGRGRGGLYYNPKSQGGPQDKEGFDHHGRTEQDRLAAVSSTENFLPVAPRVFYYLPSLPGKYRISTYCIFFKSPSDVCRYLNLKLVALTGVACCVGSMSSLLRLTLGTIP